MPFHSWLGPSFALLISDPAAGPSPEAGAPLDAQVWTAEGRQISLRSFWGKPTVVLYESRAATELNRPLKDALWRRGCDPAARGAAQVLGVAALGELDWWPARALAERAVRERQAKVGIPVLIDWKGALTGGVWQLRSDSSSVIVLDSGGKMVFRATGALDDAQVRQVFQILEDLTGHHT